MISQYRTVTLLLMFKARLIRFLERTGFHRFRKLVGRSSYTTMSMIQLIWLYANSI